MNSQMQSSHRSEHGLGRPPALLATRPEHAVAPQRVPSALCLDEKPDAVPKQVEEGRADRGEKAADEGAERGEETEKVGNHAEREYDIQHRAAQREKTGIRTQE